MLTSQELIEIKQLQEICELEGGFQLKLNFEMLENRNKDKKEDFLHFEDGKLVGFLGSYGFGNDIELCGLVHPQYRRIGIFSSLLEVAIEEAKKRNVKTILLNSPNGSQTAKEFLKTVPCAISFAEYQMKWHRTELTEDETVIVRQSRSKEDLEAEIQLDMFWFGMTEQEARDRQQEIMIDSHDQRYIIEAEGSIAGKIRISELNGEAWIYGFVVFPELRGKGIGRRALIKAVKMEHQKGLPIFLEVEAKNARAINLYESCGFKSFHVQDYYEYDMSQL